MNEAEYPRGAETSRVLGILMIATFLSLIDRQIPNFLVGPIRHSMQISDTEMSLIQGSAFAIMFALAGLPLGWLVDRTNRRNIILVGVFFWSLMTVYCGYAESFWQLFIGRVGVGIGEAALAPACYSLIADYVPPAKRGRTLSIYFLANNLGSGMALIVIGFLTSIGPVLAASSPIFAGLEPWQVAFVMAGLPGILLTPVILAIREVPRRGNNGAIVQGATASISSLRHFFRHAAAHKSLFVRVYGALSLVQFCNMASYAWAPTHFIRKFGIPAEQLGLWLGITIGSVGLIGGIISAAVTDRLASRPQHGGRLALAALTCAVIAPLHLIWPLADNLLLAFICFGATGLATATIYASSPAIVQDMVPNQMRGKAVAVYMMVLGILGYALGPTAVALATDYLYGDDSLLGWSIATVAPPTALLGLVLAISAFKPYTKLRHALTSEGA